MKYGFLRMCLCACVTDNCLCIRLLPLLDPECPQFVEGINLVVETILKSKFADTATQNFEELIELNILKVITNSQDK